MRIVLVGVICAALFFAAQLILCYKAKRTAVKLIPLYIFILPIILMIMDVAGLLSYNSVIAVQGILSMMLAIVTGFAIVGDVLAWAVYGFRMKKYLMLDAEDE